MTSSIAVLLNVTYVEANGIFFENIVASFRRYFESPSHAKKKYSYLRNKKKRIG